MSCSKAQEVLGNSSAKQLEVIDAKKEKIGDNDAWDIISKHQRVLIAKGRKTLEYEPADENREEILKQAMGRSGNLRAPTLSFGGTLMIGFNEDMYQGPW